MLPGLKPVSRYQIAFAMLMFLGSPAWIGLLVLGTLAVALAGAPAAFIRPDAGMALFVIILIMWFAPKIATVIDVRVAARSCAAPSAAPGASSPASSPRRSSS